MRAESTLLVKNASEMGKALMPSMPWRFNTVTLCGNHVWSKKNAGICQTLGSKTKKQQCDFFAWEVPDMLCAYGNCSPGYPEGGIQYPFSV